MWIDADLGGDQARNTSEPFQQRVASGAANLVQRGNCLGEIDQAALGLVQGEALRLNLQPGIGRGLDVDAIGPGQAN